MKVRGSQCRKQRCKARPRWDGLCQSHLIDEADRLFSLQVRALGRCESGRPEHDGVLQCAHGFSRSYKAVRWDPRNAFCFCGKCHSYFTHNPLEWDDWLTERWGYEFYWEIRHLALTHRTPDLELVLAELRATGGQQMNQETP